MRLIDADEFFKDFTELEPYEHISHEYDIDAVEVKHGRDIYYEAKGHCEFKCSVCGAEIGVVEGGDLDGGKFNYCPNCGAKMDGKEQNDEQTI